MSALTDIRDEIERTGQYGGLTVAGGDTSSIALYS